jgi:hypothetical protein
MPPRIFISADHGLAIVYFLQSDIINDLLDAGSEVILLTDEGLAGQIWRSFGRPGLTVESLRLKQAREYFRQQNNTLQWWLDFLRRAGASNHINLQAVESFVRQVETEAEGRRRALFPAMKALVGLMRRSRAIRQAVTRMQYRFSPDLYADLFDRYRPDLVVASTPGWRLDRYLLREATRRGITTASVIVGWDNSSSYSLPGAPVDWITCWSELQKGELILGSDWMPERVNVGGIPSYDGYFDQRWVMPRAEYFSLHSLDLRRKLISYASSFITFSPNLQNVEALARLVSSDALEKPAQLLVRLHPNHFMDVPHFVAERERIREMARQNQHVHVVEPVPLGGELGYYSGEDMPEKASMMAHSDIFTTVYSTMVVEASIHARPVVSVCLDSPVGWPGKYTLPLSQIGDWPTHQRFRQSGAGSEALDEAQLCQAINYYLVNPQDASDARQRFIRQECTYTDGSAGHRTAQFLWSILP